MKKRINNAEGYVWQTNSSEQYYKHFYNIAKTYLNILSSLQKKTFGKIWLPDQFQDSTFKYFI